MLFHILQKYPNINHAVINDINHDLIVCYHTVRDNVEELISYLKDIEQHFR
jgi:DNA adenine methylase